MILAKWVSEMATQKWIGLVERYMDGIAYVTMTGPDGERLEDELPSAAMIEFGVRERRRFTCYVAEDGEVTNVVPIPDVAITEDMEREIDLSLAGLGDAQ